jgi:hypothetical protein
MSSNTSMSSVIDWYVLGALRALPPSGKGNCETRDMKSDIFVSRVNYLYDELTNRLGDCFAAYVLYAATGEARHAWHRVNGDMINKFVIPYIGNDRDTVMTNANKFEPVSLCETLESIFGQSGWSSAFGGRAWLAIVRSLDFYFNPPTIEKIDWVNGGIKTYGGDYTLFIDHLIDLKHNGGSLFNKSGALSRSKIHMDISEGSLMDFLDFKRNSSLLVDIKDSMFWSYLSKEVRNLLGGLVYGGDCLLKLGINPLANWGWQVINNPTELVKKSIYHRCRLCSTHKRSTYLIEFPKTSFRYHVCSPCHPTKNMMQLYLEV